MKKFVFVWLVLIASVAAVPQEAKTADPTITFLSKFVGGKWVSEGQPSVVQEWTWNRDKRGLSVVSEIAKGTPNETLSRAFFGWDPLKKKTYYLDMHDSALTFSGHVSVKDDTVEFAFGQLGSDKISWIERGRFLSDDSWEATMYQIKDGKEQPLMSFKMRRKL